MLDGFPERLRPPASMEQGERLLEFIDEVRRMLGRVNPVGIGLLLPESGTPRAAERCTIETLIRVAAAQEKLPLEVLARPTVRSRLALPQSGSLASHARDAVGTAVGAHWGHRSLAAMVATATEV